MFMMHWCSFNDMSVHDGYLAKLCGVAGDRVTLATAWQSGCISAVCCPTSRHSRLANWRRLSFDQTGISSGATRFFMHALGINGASRFFA